MKSCNGCIHENLKNMAWGSTQPHPCTNCSRITYDPLDKYQPKVDCPTDPECQFCECEDKYQQTYNSLFNKGKLVCAKCHKPIKPTQKPKIEEIEIKGLDNNFSKMKRMADKINTLIRAVNGLYER